MKPMRTTPITDASAWKNADVISNESWKYFFDPAELAEIDAALAHIKKQGLKWAEFTAEEFSIPLFQAKLALINEQIVSGRGFALLKGFPVHAYSLDDIKTIYWGLGCHIGQVISNNAAGDFVSPVTDLGEMPFDPNRRNNTTPRLLEPHTDLADVVILLCIEKAKEGGLSTIASCTAIYNEILATRPELLPALYEGFYRDFRGDGYTGDPDEVTPVPIPVFEYHNGKVSCAFARKIILDGAAKAGLELTDLQKEAVDLVNDLGIREDMRLDMMLEPGDIQFLNNYANLHSRSAYVDYDATRKRYLLRMWINWQGDSRLSPEFAAIVRRGIPARNRQTAESA